jgi:hypothetical protein
MTDVLESAPHQSNPPATDKLAGRVAFVTGGTRGIGRRSRTALPIRARRSRWATTATRIVPTNSSQAC